MAQSLTMRATSLAASAAMLALVGIAAFSMKWAVAIFTPDHPLPPITSVTEPTAPPPPSHPIQPVRPPDAAHPSEQTVDPATTIPTSTEPPAAGAAIPDLGPPTISNPHWLQVPRDLSRYYPVMALRREMEGSVQLDCLVTVAGQLQCTVASETPANWGFGAAAIRIAQDYRMAPATRGGVAVEGRYRMRVPFRLNR